MKSVKIQPNFINLEINKDEMISNIKSFAPVVGQFGDILSKQSYSCMANDMKENMSEIYKLLEAFQQHTENINKNLSSINGNGFKYKDEIKHDMNVNENDGKMDFKVKENELKQIVEIEDDYCPKTNIHSVEILEIDDRREEKKVKGDLHTLFDMLLKLMSYFKSVGSYFTGKSNVESFVFSSTQRNTPKSETKNGKNDISIDDIFRICAISAFGITLLQCVNKSQLPMAKIFVTIIEEYIITLLTKTK